MHFCLESDIIVKVFRGVAQVVERYFREVEAASSSLVTPIMRNLESMGLSRFFYVQRQSKNGRNLVKNECVPTKFQQNLRI